MTALSATRSPSAPRHGGSAGAPPGRRVLLAVTGLSPQVVTETVFALAEDGDAARLPTEIHVLSTAEGAERARLTLLGRDPGWFHRLLHEYRLPSIRFAEDSIHVVTDAQGRPVADIRSAEDNTRLADAITGLIRRFTADRDGQLHVSIAGGRKTMGFYAGYALSMFGRAQDRLSHVLVSPPFESHPEFFFPPRARRTIYDRDRRPLDASKAVVTLTEIPFVRLRHAVPKPLLKGQASFGATVAALSQSTEVPRLRVEVRACRIHCGAISVTLPPREMAFLLWVARRRVQRRAGVCCPHVPDAELAREYLDCYRSVRPDAPGGSGPARSLRKGMEAGFFSTTKTKLESQLRAAGIGAPYLIQRTPFPDRPAEFELPLAPGAIHFEESEARKR